MDGNMTTLDGWRLRKRFKSVKSEFSAEDVEFPIGFEELPSLRTYSLAQIARLLLVSEDDIMDISANFGLECYGLAFDRLKKYKHRDLVRQTVYWRIPVRLCKILKKYTNKWVDLGQIHGDLICSDPSVDPFIVLDGSQIRAADELYRYQSRSIEKYDFELKPFMQEQARIRRSDIVFMPRTVLRYLNFENYRHHPNLKHIGDLFDLDRAIYPTEQLRTAIIARKVSAGAVTQLSQPINLNNFDTQKNNFRVQPSSSISEESDTSLEAQGTAGQNKQEKIILDWLIQQNYDPLNLPQKQGYIGPKKLARDALVYNDDEQIFTLYVFNKTWERCRKKNKIISASEKLTPDAGHLVHLFT